MNTVSEPDLIFGVMTYSEMMSLRRLYVRGVRNDQTRKANSLYFRINRRGWTESLKERYKNKH